MKNKNKILIPLIFAIVIATAIFSTQTDLFKGRAKLDFTCGKLQSSCARGDKNACATYKKKCVQTTQTSPTSLENIIRRMQPPPPPRVTLAFNRVDLPNPALIYTTQEVMQFTVQTRGGSMRIDSLRVKCEGDATNRAGFVGNYTWLTYHGPDGDRIVAENTGGDCRTGITFNTRTGDQYLAFEPGIDGVARAERFSIFMNTEIDEPVVTSDTLRFIIDAASGMDGSENLWSCDVPSGNTARCPGLPVTGQELALSRQPEAPRFMEVYENPAYTNITVAAGSSTVRLASFVVRSLATTDDIVINQITARMGGTIPEWSISNLSLRREWPGSPTGQLFQTLWAPRIGDNVFSLLPTNSTIRPGEEAYFSLFGDISPAITSYGGTITFSIPENGIRATLDDSGSTVTAPISGDVSLQTVTLGTATEIENSLRIYRDAAVEDSAHVSAGSTGAIVGSFVVRAPNTEPVRLSDIALTATAGPNAFSTLYLNQVLPTGAVRLSTLVVPSVMGSYVFIFRLPDDGILIPAGEERIFQVEADIISGAGGFNRFFAMGRGSHAVGQTSATLFSAPRFETPFQLFYIEPGTGGGPGPTP